MRGNKDFKKGVGKLGQVVGALKKGGIWNPLTNYVIHELNILLEGTERSTFSKIGEQSNDLIID